MALFNSLTFDGVNSLDSGIYITGEAVYNAPQRQVEMVTIPGRNGTLAIDQGRFENIEVTYPAGCFADDQSDFASKIMEFRNELASRFGYKRLVDTYHPDEFRLGTYSSGLEVGAVGYHRAGEFDITFDCKPQRFLVSGEETVTIGEWGETETATGDIVEIDNPDSTLGVKSLLVTLDPIQEGSGTPSPDNVRPISGRTEVVTQRTGKNLLPYPYGDGASKTTNGITYTVNSDGSVTANGTATADNVFYLISSGTSALANKGIASGAYILNGAPSTSASSNYYIQLQYNGTFVSAYASGTTFTYNASSSANDMLRIYVKSGAVLNNVKFYPMLRLASDTDDTYEPYQGNTYTTALGRTVYGGTLDVVSGELTVTWGYIASYNGETLTGRWLSSLDEYAQGTTPTTGAQVVYELVTPQTYTLTPQQIDLLLGDNNVWSDGRITIEYGLSPNIIVNPTLFASNPLLVVTGSGTLSIGNQTLTIASGSADQVIYIDCDSQEAWEIVGGGKLSRNDYIQNAGESFPVLNPGANNFTLGTGITRVEVTPRWWRI